MVYKKEDKVQVYKPDYIGNGFVEPGTLYEANKTTKFLGVDINEEAEKEIKKGILTDLLDYAYYMDSKDNKAVSIFTYLTKGMKVTLRQLIIKGLLTEELLGGQKIVFNVKYPPKYGVLETRYITVSISGEWIDITFSKGLIDDLFLLNKMICNNREYGNCETLMSNLIFNKKRPFGVPDEYYFVSIHDIMDISRGRYKYLGDIK